MASQALVQDMTDQQLQEHAFRVLAKELGLGGLARFIRLNLSGHGDYTAERHTWQEGLTIEQVLAGINARRTADAT
jgi:hypothetical protein